MLAFIVVVVIQAFIWALLFLRIIIKKNDEFTRQRIWSGRTLKLSNVKFVLWKHCKQTQQQCSSQFRLSHSSITFKHGLSGARLLDNDIISVSLTLTVNLHNISRNFRENFFATLEKMFWYCIILQGSNSWSAMWF